MNAPPLVCVWGDETYLKDLAVAEVEAEALEKSDRALNRQAFEAPAAKPADVLNAARTLPFLGARRLVIVKDADRWKANDWNMFASYFKAPNQSTCLLFIAASLDKRFTAVKDLVKNGRVVECRKPKEGELHGWAVKMFKQAGMNPDGQVLRSLVVRVGPDLEVMSHEVEKLRLFAGEGGSITAEDVESLVGNTRTTNVFAFCDALGRRDLGGALSAFSALLLLGEAPVKILHMAARHFRLLWIGGEILQSKKQYSRQAVAAALKTSPFFVESIMKQARLWDDKTMRVVFSLLLSTDESLKSGGGKEAAEALLIKLCRLNSSKKKSGSHFNPLR